MSDSLWPYGLWPTRLLYPWDSPGKNTRVGCHALLQGIFLTQGSNAGLLHCRHIIYRWATKEAHNTSYHVLNNKYTEGEYYNFFQLRRTYYWVPWLLGIWRRSRWGHCPQGADNTIGDRHDRILLLSIKPQHESAIGIHICLPCWNSLSSLTPSQPSR